jgi:hypothetical protein
LDLIQALYPAGLLNNVVRGRVCVVSVGRVGACLRTGKDKAILLICSREAFICGLRDVLPDWIDGSWAVVYDSYSGSPS